VMNQTKTIILQCGIVQKLAILRHDFKHLIVVMDGGHLLHMHLKEKLLKKNGGVAMCNYEPFDRVFSIDQRENKWKQSNCYLECVEIRENTKFKTSLMNIQKFSVPARNSFSN
jgi:hypothetical protein